MVFIPGSYLLSKQLAKKNDCRITSDKEWPLLYLHSLIFSCEQTNSSQTLILRESISIKGLYFYSFLNYFQNTNFILSLILYIFNWNSIQFSELSSRITARIPTQQTAMSFQVSSVTDPLNIDSCFIRLIKFQFKIKETTDVVPILVQNQFAADSVDNECCVSRPSNK